MDVKLQNKDIELNPNGSAVKVQGIDQIIQQINIGTSVVRGSFALDKQLGIMVADIDFENDNALKNLEAVLKEMLINTPEVNIQVNYINISDDDKTAGITVGDGYSTRDIEVKING